MHLLDDKCSVISTFYLAGKYNKHWKWAWIIIISIINQHNNVKIKSWVKVHYLFKIHGVAKYTE